MQWYLFYINVYLYRQCHLPKEEYVMYKLSSGIKQGLPLSPLLFIFYFNDIFDTFKCIYKLIHLLVHADDVTLLETLRDSAILKLLTLSESCSLNCILPQFTICMFIMINGSSEDQNLLPFGNYLLKNTSQLEILGSHISQSSSLVDELEIHMKKRSSSCIKFFNFCKENPLARLSHPEFNPFFISS